MGVGCPCPPVRYDIVTPCPLFQNVSVQNKYVGQSHKRSLVNVFASILLKLYTNVVRLNHVIILSILFLAQAIVLYSTMYSIF